MTFTDLFVSKTKKHPSAEGAEGAKCQSTHKKMCVTEGNTHISIYVREDPDFQPSAPSAPSDRPAMVPLETPWIEGARYREAGATDLGKRTLYFADPAGLWIRQHGTLIAVTAP